MTDLTDPSQQAFNELANRVRAILAAHYQIQLDQAQCRLSNLNQIAWQHTWPVLRQKITEAGVEDEDDLCQHLVGWIDQIIAE